jgi:D-amino peptidase
MNILIITDLEGISGIDSVEMVSDVGTPKHRFACERLMLDLNAAVEGAIDGGADNVYVVDGHGGGGNFISEMLHPKAIQLKSALRNEKMKNNKINAIMVIGAHAMAGTINGFYDHTQDSRAWYNYTVNGRKCGELAQTAIFAGAFDIPLIMVSGDEAACVEAKAFVSGVECALVKYGIGRNKARLVDLDKSLEEIKNSARNSMKLIDSIKPFKPLLPLNIELTLYRTDMCDKIVEKCANCERIDARTVRKTVSKIENYMDLLFV